MVKDCFSLESNTNYHPGDCDKYYLTEYQVEMGIKHIEKLYKDDKRLSLTVEFIQFHEKALALRDIAASFARGVI